MVKLVFTPDWFLNNDILIEIVIFLVLFMFFIFSTRYYQLNKNKGILYLGIGFLLVAIGEAASILTKLVLYYDTDITREIGHAIITHDVLTSVDIFYYAGFFITKFFVLMGFYLIYKIPASRKLTTEFLLIVYLLAVTAILSQNIPYLYHLTVFVLLFLIIRNYYRIYAENKSSNTKTLILAFTILAFSQIIFIFSEFRYFYVTAQGIQLVSYIILLVLIIKIHKNGAKKEPNRHTA